MKTPFAVRAAGIAAASCIALAGCHSSSSDAAGDTGAKAPSSSATHDPSTTPTPSTSPRPEPGPAKPTTHPAKPSRSAHRHPKAPGLQHTLAPSAKPGGGPTAGGEGATAKATGQCKITGGPDVAAAFGGRVDTVSGSTSGTGNPLCRITLTDSNAGAPGVVTLSLTASANRATFAQVQRSMHGQAVAGVGDRAFYLLSAETLQFLSGHTAVTLQADIQVPGQHTPSPERVKADLVTLAKRIAASL
jgi:hypothetical protein